MNNFDGRAFSLFETVAVTGSRIKTLALLWYAQAWRIRPLQIHNNFSNGLAVPNKHRIFTLGSKETFCRNSINLTADETVLKCFKCQADADWYEKSMPKLGYFVIYFQIALHF